ncbi:MAG: hypothetical protein LBI87_03950 [Candidatus Accumulibacter sp.]|nr:hypothetical protein [Accumulibacter sp.]
MEKTAVGHGERGDTAKRQDVLFRMRFIRWTMTRASLEATLPAASAAADDRGR